MLLEVSELNCNFVLVLAVCNIVCCYNVSCCDIDFLSCCQCCRVCAEYNAFLLCDNQGLLFVIDVLYPNIPCYCVADLVCLSVLAGLLDYLVVRYRFRIIRICSVCDCQCSVCISDIVIVCNIDSRYVDDLSAAWNVVALAYECL